MTATAVHVSQQAQQKQGISDKEWVALFPKQVTENCTSSITFIKQLTMVAVSTITYLKNALPEDCYSSEMFGGLKLKLLKASCEDELAQFISTSMWHAFDAFDRKYAHLLALCFYRGVCSAENLIEYHVFEYSYSAEGVTLTVNSKNRESAKRTLRCSTEAVRTCTVMLVRSLSQFVWQNCMELPENYDVSLRLFYNDDAPDDYQAPGFSPSLETDHDHLARAPAVRVGRVETPFHSLTARSFVRDHATVPGDSDAAVPSNNVTEITQDGSEDYSDWGARSEASGSARPRVLCPCGRAGTAELATCRYCHTQQHAACFGLLAPVPEHCCAECAAQDLDRVPSCQLLVGLEPGKQQSLCILRRTLALCSRQPELRGEELRARLGLDAADAAKLLRVLQAHAVLPYADTHDLMLPRKIDPARLKLVSKHFFRMEDQEDSTVGRLMAEMGRCLKRKADGSRDLKPSKLPNWRCD